MRAQWKSAALLTVLLIASLALGAASTADAQTFIGPGTITGTQTVTEANSPATVVGNTTINVPGGDGIDAPPDAASGGTLTINTQLAPTAIPGPGPITITSGGTGVASIFPSSPATINILSGRSGDVTIISGGAALGIAGDVSLTASNANGGNLIFQSTGTFGVSAQFDATINLTGATIGSSGGLAAVLIGGGATNIGAQATLTDVNISANGTLIGLDATRMGTVVTLTGGSITVIGASISSAGIAGLYSDTDGVTNTTNVKIMTTGPDTSGAFAEATNPVAGGSVSPGGGTINITGGSITTRGMDAFGVFAQGQPTIPSTITLDNSAITTTGPGAAAYRADGGAISATNTIVQTSGVMAPGGMLSNGGKLTINGGSVTTTGAGSFGFLVQPFTPMVSLTAEPTLPSMPLTSEPALPNVLQISNATVNSAADAFHVDGATANIAINGSSVMSGNGVLLNTLSSGATNLTATASHLTGLITTDSSSTANVTLQGDSTWTMTGSSNLTNLVNDPSTIIFTPPTGDPTQLASYKTLSTTNYTGVGGAIELNTFLGADNSPSDRLIINGGAASGDTFLHVTNTGGPGAETLSNGIAVVQAINGATTTPGAFTLAGEARAGASDYDLFHGGVGGSDPQDWFLRSSFIVGPLPPGPEQPTDPTFPPYPPPQPLPPGVYPIIGPELATYGVVQPLARQLGVTTLGTLHDRIGDTLTNGAGPCSASAGSAIVRKGYDTPPQSTNCDVYGWWPSAWGRVFGQSVDNRYSAFADPRTSGQVLGFQAGLDVWRGSLIPGHSDTAGFYAAYANGAVDVTGLVTNRAVTAYVLQHTGTVNLNAVSGGAYWTHYGPGGWYLDAVAQGTVYSGSASTQFASLGPTGYGFVASLEGGYPIALPTFGPGFVLEPEAQVLWQTVRFDQTNDQFGYVALGATYGGTSRLGLRGKWDIVGDNGFVWQPYLHADFWDDWGGNATTDFRGDAVPLLEADRRLELGGGLTTKVNANLSFYANADYQFAVSDTDGGKRNGFGGAAGLRYMW